MTHAAMDAHLRPIVGTIFGSFIGSSWLEYLAYYVAKFFGLMWPIFGILLLKAHFLPSLLVATILATTISHWGTSISFLRKIK